MCPQDIGVDDGFGHWFAGFIDGEGCFYVRRSRNRYRAGSYVSYGCSLSVAVRDDDLAVLELIRDRLGMGVISRRHQRTSSGQNPSACLSIHNKADVLRVVELLEWYPLRTKKARDFEVWRRVVREWHRVKGAKGRARDWSAMARLHDELKEVRRYA